MCLSYDEIGISSKIEFDVKNEEVIGPCFHAQVLIARSIVGQWKQPIYYAYDKTMDRPTILEAIARLHNAGYETVAISSDMGGGNVGVWRDFGISMSKPYFVHPETCTKVYAFADAPHMLKLLRNHFLDEGFLLENAHVVNKKHVEKLVQMSSKNDLKIAHKLTAAKLDVKGPQRQSVESAVQLFSNTASKALEFCFKKRSHCRSGRRRYFWFYQTNQ